MVDWVRKYVELLDVDEGWGYYFEHATATHDTETGILTEDDAEKVCARAYVFNEATEVVSKGDSWVYIVITKASGENNEYFIDAVTVNDEEPDSERRKSYTVKGEVELKNMLLRIVKEEFA